MGIIGKIKSELAHVPGWHSGRKIVVIESDDWGCVRMPSVQDYLCFLEKGIPVDKDPYTRLDGLESDDDMIGLLEILSKHQNNNGQQPVFTANTIVANPDFERIASDNFEQYYYEPFTTTLQRYPKHSKVWKLYEEGINANIFRPQLHGREHVNINQWLASLKVRDPYTISGFTSATFAISPKAKSNKRNNFMAALDYESEADKVGLSEIVSSGAQLFTNLFGYQSASFIAPAYIWSEDLEAILWNQGVRTLQGISYQYQPDPGANWYKKKYHYTGQRNRIGQVYLSRNCFFEPSIQPNIDSIDRCLSRIQMAFRWRKPAIIGTHRLNFIGYINPANRDKNLKSFDELLRRITQTWPDVEFMSSDQLGDLIASPPQT